MVRNSACTIQTTSAVDRGRVSTPGAGAMNTEVWMSGDQHTVPWLLERRLESDPDGEYLDVCGETVTARQVHDVAGRVANSLLALGVRQGDRVATLIENSVEATLAWWGIIHAGAIAVPINTAYKGQY